MKLCIAEKPSVAKDLANILGANARHDGYFEGNGYLVSWTFGHLCTLKEPQDYKDHWKYWKIEDLPIFPERFGIKIKENQGVQKQFELITKLITKATEVINCGDAGQEGEVIQRWVLIKANCQVPVKRLWISSLTEEAIKEGFKKLQDASKYDNLFAAGNSRAIGDWILGINGTRLYTKKFGKNKTTLSVGRVQTPTLAMIVNRQHEIKNFKVEYFWELKTKYRETEFLCQIARLKSKNRAEEGISYLKDKPFEIVSYEQKEGKENNPRLYDLTSVQVEANKKYGYTADETLKTVQSLYEKKLVTYPRVDTTYLSEDLHPKVPQILKNLTQYASLIAPILKKPVAKSKTIFNDKKITDHHAIIPTGVNGQGLSGYEEKIYDLISKRFIAVFYPPCKVSNTTVIGKVEKLEFKTSGKQIISLGWRAVYKEDSKTESTENSKKKPETKEVVLPNFEKGESGPHEPIIHEGKTSPPKYFTEATLLRRMETAGKFVENDEMRDLMKENGIGRPSTRANIIETLFRRNYIERKKKNIHATDLGMALIGTIKSDLLKSPELTGQWENKLRQIEKGTLSPSDFRQELFQMIRKLTDEVIFN
ncbi:MAG: DNA topoisomerase 3 [Crocinitomicaceae bacterium]|nr:DNA topoisomerase 3 [Crocinitomicaceae bacterium]